MGASNDLRQLVRAIGPTSQEAGSDRDYSRPEERFSYLEWYYADNGFRSRDGMDSEHEPVLKLASAILARQAGNVLDLGCGNGVLLKKLGLCNLNLSLWGVDKSKSAIAHARLLIPQFAANFVCSDIFDDCGAWSENREFELVILMLGRLREVPGPRAKKLLRRIEESAKHLLVYAYDAVLHQSGSLDELARKTGVALYDGHLGDNVGMVRLRG